MVQNRNEAFTLLLQLSKIQVGLRKNKTVQRSKKISSDPTAGRRFWHCAISKLNEFAAETPPVYGMHALMLACEERQNYCFTIRVTELKKKNKRNKKRKEKKRE